MKGKKTGGRQKGSTNIVTRTTRDIIKDIVDRNIDKVDEKLSKLKPKDFCDVFLGLCKYVVPTLQSISLDDANCKVKITIEDRLSELADEVEEEKK